MTPDSISKFSWPVLPQPFGTALRQAAEFIVNELEPVGVIATGSIIHGTAHPSSDLDLYVVHLAPYRRRIQRYCSGVPVEIFVNPPAAIRAYFAEEDRDGRRLTAHMLATGRVIFRADPVVDVLRVEAAEWLAKRTVMSEFERVSSRYTIASQLEDALDVLASDDVTAEILLGESVLAMLEYLYRAEHGQIPRRKDLLAAIAVDHPDVAARTAALFGGGQLADRAQIALEIADRTIGARGFFEWDSGAGPAPG